MLDLPALDDPRRLVRKLPPDTPPLDRVLLRVTVDPSGCWIFGGAIDSGGYGVIRDHGRNERTHVITFRAEHGYAPADRGLVVDHLCRVRACCRPDHLEGVTTAVNTARGLGGLRTHCRRGHAMTPDNVYPRPDGRGRQCRTCIKIRTSQG